MIRRVSKFQKRWLNSVGSAATCHVVASHQRRNYQYQVKDDLVPEGASVSRFAAATTPSERVKIQREYALSPIFGARAVATVIGTTTPAPVFYARKREVAKAVDAALLLPEGTTTLGTLRELHPLRFQTDSQNGLRRTRGDVKIVTASVLCDVHFPVEWDVEEIAVFGEELRRIIMAGGDAAAAFRLLGVVHAETPEADTPPFFSCYNGEELDEKEVADVQERWAHRVGEVQEELRRHPPKLEKSPEELQDDLEYETSRVT